MHARVQIKAGLRVAVQPHGGHFWSSMGQVQRPMDIVSLRIDNQVRSMLLTCSPILVSACTSDAHGSALPLQFSPHASEYTH